MSQKITKDLFEICYSPSIASNNRCNSDQINNKLNLLLTNIKQIYQNILKILNEKNSLIHEHSNIFTLECMYL
jgi:hypothetical protein